MWEIFKAGGPVMWPILLCSIAAAAIVLERMWTLQAQRVIPRDLTAKVWKLVETRTLTDRHVVALEHNSPLGRVLAAGLANRHRGRDVLKEAVEDTGRHVVHELERFLNTLGTIALISPLLGLLGTVFGLIEMFFAVMVSGVGDPLKMAGGIGQALVCTATGLCVAIPAYFFHRYFRGRVADYVVDMEEQTIRLIDELSAHAEPATASAATSARATAKAH